MDLYAFFAHSPHCSATLVRIGTALRLAWKRCDSSEQAARAERCAAGTPSEIQPVPAPRPPAALPALAAAADMGSLLDGSLRLCACWERHIGRLAWGPASVGLWFGRCARGTVAAATALRHTLHPTRHLLILSRLSWPDRKLAGALGWRSLGRFCIGGRMVAGRPVTVAAALWAACLIPRRIVSPGPRSSAAAALATLRQGFPSACSSRQHVPALLWPSFCSTHPSAFKAAAGIELGEHGAGTSWVP